MQKSARLLKIWKLCREHKFMTAPKLAQACGVTERQIYRDLKTLMELGVTISMNGGYRVLREDVLPQLNLSPAERMVLTMALRALPLLQDKELETLANSLFNKLLDRPESESPAIFEHGSVAKMKGRVFARLQKAIEERCFVTLIDYVKFDNEVLPQRKVAPYYLVHRERHWYLIAWSELKGDFQTYRLDRIGKLRIEDETYSPHPFDLEDYFRGTIGAFVDQPQRLRVRFTGIAKEVVKKGGRVAPENLCEEEDALILETIMRGEILWLRWILGFGGEAEILEPQDMREKAKKTLRAGLEQYYDKNPNQNS